VVDHLGWSMTLQLLIVPAIIAAILWFFVKPDKPLIVSEEHVNK
ncbi:MFS transporter, partial [Staphylococcus warneri]